jgi:hypothetical protein
LYDAFSLGSVRCLKLNAIGAQGHGMPQKVAAEKGESYIAALQHVATHVAIVIMGWWHA